MVLHVFSIYIPTKYVLLTILICTLGPIKTFQISYYIVSVPIYVSVFSILIICHRYFGATFLFTANRTANIVVVDWLFNMFIREKR